MVKAARPMADEGDAGTRQRRRQENGALPTRIKREVEWGFAPRVDRFFVLVFEFPPYCFGFRYSDFGFVSSCSSW
jgi:hypothetical protein